MEKEKKKTNYGLWAVLVKLGPKLASVFTKFLKSAKVVKGGLAAASLVSYSFLFTWEFAVIIMTMLFIHESGHVWAMRKCGIATKGFYFIPLIGGAAVAEESFKTRSNESFIAIMGPIWGLALSAIVLGLYYIFHTPIFAAAAGWMALINLFNLIPVNPLDGGRILKSLVLSIGLDSEIRRKGAIISLIIVSTILLCIFMYLQIWLFVIFGSIGLLEIIFELKKSSNMEPIPSDQILKHFAVAILVGALLFGIMYITKHLPGSDVAMEVLKG